MTSLVDTVDLTTEVTIKIMDESVTEEVTTTESDMDTTTTSQNSPGI